MFRMTPGGDLTTLYAFSGGDGDPRGQLAEGADGSFYSTTVGWGNSGTVFKITTNGALTTLVSFVGTNGSKPFAGLVLASNGFFYGTTVAGTVFKMSQAGELTTLIWFTNEGRVYSGLTLGLDGNLYGSTWGSSNSPASVHPGIAFRMTPEGTLTTLATFDYGVQPQEILQAVDGNLYGTTYYGGSANYGFLFQIATDGGLSALHSFTCDAVGIQPSDLMRATDGLIYGTTAGCGADGYGTVFQVSPGLAPLIMIQNPVLNGTEFSFEWNAITGRVYAVEWGSNLFNWYNLNSSVLATGSTMRISSSTLEPQRFFRVGLKP